MRVKAFATQLGYLLGLSPFEHHLLRLGAWFHDVGNAIDRSGRTVIVHLDAIQQGWTGSAGANRLEVATQDLDCRGHAMLGGLEDLIK